MDMRKAMQQAQALQTKMADMQKKLEQEIVEGTSGGGMVKLTSTCKGEVKGISIDSSLLVADEKEVLEDLIVSAFNNARKNADAKMADEMKKMTESLGIPSGMLNFPF